MHEHDVKTVSALLNYFRKCYILIGLIVAGFGAALIPFVHILVKSDIPDGVNIYFIYFINLLGTLSTYFFFSYKRCIFIADQRNDIDSKIAIFSSTILYIIQFIILVFLNNYYLFISVVPICNIISNLMVSIVAKLKYPEYICAGHITSVQKNELRSKIKALFFVKFGNVVLYSVDNIVISAFLGLSVLGLYSNYNYIYTSVNSFIGLLTASIVSSIGNSIVTQNRSQNYDDFLKLSFWNFWLVGWCTVCFVCLYQPFIKIWVGDNYLLPVYIPVVISMYFYVIQSNQVAGAYKDAAGIWESDKFRPLITALVNLFFNILLVNYIGLYGIVLSTLLSFLFVNFPWIIINVHKLVFASSTHKYFLMWIRNTLCTIFACFSTYFLCEFAELYNSIVSFCIKLLICIIFPNLIFVSIFCKLPVFRDGLVAVRTIILRGTRRRESR